MDMIESNDPAADPRTTARQIVKESVAPDLWRKNEAFTRKLVDLMRAHRLSSHPVIDAFNRKHFTCETMAMVHSEVRVAFAEHFTDGLIRLMQTTGELERRLGPKAKMAARFLIELNVLEELGFKPGPGGTGRFYGHPGFSHYWQLTDTLAALDQPESKWASYVPAPESLAVRERLLGSFHDHLRLATILAGIETVFVPYYGPWAVNTIAVAKTDISGGYHSIHVEDSAGVAVDDDHSEDSWYVVRQALTPERYGETEAFLVEVLDEWARFVDMFLVKDRAMRSAA
jgi:hypothetical protein